jgi:hypothetical protein
MEKCTRCKERWFQMELNSDKICTRCRKGLLESTSTSMLCWCEGSNTSTGATLSTSFARLAWCIVSSRFCHRN